MEKKLIKLQSQSQERIEWKSTGMVVLGLAPRLWIEILDVQHRYASVLHGYFQRWELSATDEDFFDWLDEGVGQLVDLPLHPRRLLDEWQVVYLSTEEQRFFRVKIQQGRFLWEFDDSPVTLHQGFFLDKEAPTEREKGIYNLLEGRLTKARRGDELLAEARAEAQQACAAKEPLTQQRLKRITDPLIEEGLLRQLRDPAFQERLDARPEKMQARRSLFVSRESQDIDYGTDLLPGATWEKLLSAISHDEGRFMKGNQPLSEVRDPEKGIFVVDKFGDLYCGSKVRGLLQHSSFIRGHCVRAAGGAVIEDGWLKELSPHSGHYQPLRDQVDDMISGWQKRGVHMDKVVVANYTKS